MAHLLSIKMDNKSSIESNFTSFMFNNIFCEINIKNVIHWGGARGELGSNPNFLLEV